MLENLMCTEDLVSYNRYVAGIFGVSAAVYIQQLINITCKAVRKKTIDENGYFTLDRNYIKELTALTEKEQLEIDDRLIQAEIISKPDLKSDKIKLDITTLTTIVSSDDKKLIKNVENLVKRQPRKTREQKNVENLQSYIQSIDPEIRDTYVSWIDGVVAKDGYMTTAAVQEGQKMINSFSKGNRNVALDVIRIAAINGYRDMNWAISRYQEDNKFMNTTINTSVTSKNRTLGNKVSLPF